MLSKLLNRTVTITHRSASTDTDDYGNEIATETTTDTTGELQQQRRDEQDLAGETSDTHWLLILPAGTTIGTGDSVEVDGHVYELVGEPWPARNPRTRAESHIEATLRRVAGSEDAS
jgi:hypothetical protein